MVSDIRYFMFNHYSVIETEDGFVVPGRCGDLPIHIGDEIGGCIVTEIEACEFTPPLKTAGLLFQSVAPVEQRSYAKANSYLRDSHGCVHLILVS